MLIIACGALIVLAGTAVMWPLFHEPKGNLEVELLAETELDRLLNRKAIVYTNIKDLEFEYKMGRLSDSDYRRLEAGYKSEAAAILQKLDQLGEENKIDEAIERDVALRRGKISGQVALEGKSSSVCPACGASIVPGKRFCADCGRRL